MKIILYSITIFFYSGIQCLIIFFFADRNYSFRIDELGMIITTSKKWGGKFFVYFNDDIKKERELKKEDYIIFETGGNLEIVIDPERNCKDIYIMDYYADALSCKEKKYKFRVIKRDVFYNHFTKDGRFIPSVISIGIDSRYYEIIVNKQIIKKGNILGN